MLQVGTSVQCFCHILFTYLDEKGLWNSIIYPMFPLHRLLQEFVHSEQKLKFDLPIIMLCSKHFQELSFFYVLWIILVLRDFAAVQVASLWVVLPKQRLTHSHVHTCACTYTHTYKLLQSRVVKYRQSNQCDTLFQGDKVLSHLTCLVNKFIMLSK